MRRAAVACAFALVAIWLLAPFAPAPTSLATYRVAVYGSALAFFVVLGVVVLGAVLELTRVRTRTVVAAAIAAAALSMLGNVLDVPVASDVAKVCFAILAGVAMVRVIERPWWLLPIALCVPVADIWSVFSDQGVTKAVVDKAAKEPRWIDWPTIATPIAGFDYDDFGRLGIVDVFFLTIFIAAAVRWSLGARRLTVALPLTFVATVVIVNEWIDTAVPALPLLCLAFLVLAWPGLWRDLRAEWRGTADT